MYSTTVFVFLIALTILPITEQSIINGEDLYEQAANDWIFAYRDYEKDIEFFSLTNSSVIPGEINLMSDFNLPNDSFVTPVIGFNIDIPFYLNTGIYSGLLLTRHMLIRMVQEQSMRWNDPEIVSINPELSSNTVLVRMYFDYNPSPINGKIITWLFGAQVAADCGNSFSNLVDFGYVAPKHGLVDGLLNVVQTTASSVNTLSFAPPQFVKDLNNPNLRHANLMVFPEGEPENGTVTNETIYEIINYQSPINITLKQQGQQLIVSAIETNTTWPFPFFGYYTFTDNGENCYNNTVISRFFYWVLGTSYLEDKNEENGYVTLPSKVLDISRRFLKKASCSGQKMLVYENISAKTRENSVYIVGIVFTAVYIFLFAFVWFIHRSKSKPALIIVFSITFFGLFSSIAAYTLWWYTPDTDGICIARYWILGMSFINVNATLFGYVFSVNMIFRNMGSEKPLSKNPVQTWHLAAAYAVVNIIEIIILIIMMIVEQPRSEEKIVDETNWETVYTCVENTGIMFTIQLIYFCCVCLWGCQVLYKFIATQHGREDFRPHINSLHAQLYLIIPLIIILRLVDLSDNQLYGIMIPFFIFLNGIVTSCFVLPKLFDKLQDLSSSKSSGRTMNLAPSGSTRNLGEELSLEEVKTNTNSA